MKLPIKPFQILATAAVLCLPFSLAHANDNSPLGRYLECLNSQTKGNDNKNSDRISNADKVLEACAHERQAVLDSMPEDAAVAQLGRIERHLKGREEKSKDKKDNDQTT